MTNSKLYLVMLAISMLAGCEDSNGRPGDESPRIDPTPTVDVDLGPVNSYFGNVAIEVPEEVVGTSDDMDDMGGDTDGGMDPGMDPEMPPATGDDSSSTSGGGDGDDSMGGSTGGEEPCGFVCENGACIDASWVCDGIVDCPSWNDEYACAAGPGIDSLTQSGSTVALDTACVVDLGEKGWDVGGHAGDATAKICKKIGVKVKSYGYAAAVVCHAMDWTGADELAGKLAGGGVGLMAGAVVCEGGVIDQVSAAWDWLWGTGQVETFVVDAGEPVNPTPTGPMCTGAYEYEAIYDSSACGYETSMSLACYEHQSCDELLELADRNRVCRMAKIIVANSDFNGDPPEHPLSVAEKYGHNSDDCVELMQDKGCSGDPISSVVAEERAMELVCD